MVFHYSLPVLFSFIRMFYTPYYKFITSFLAPSFINSVSYFFSFVFVLVFLHHMQFHRRLFVLSFVGALGGYLISVGINRLQALSSIAFLQLMPLFVGIISLVYLKEKPSTLYWFSILLASAGGLIYKFSSFEPNLGLFVILAGVVLFSFNINLIREYSKKIPPLQVNLNIFLSATILNTLIAVWEGGFIFTFQSTLAVLGITFIGLSTDIIATFSMKHITSYEFTLITTVLTFLGSSALSIAWLGETLSLQQGIGMFLMVSSGIVASLKR